MSDVAFGNPERLRYKSIGREAVGDDVVLPGADPGRAVREAQVAQQFMLFLGAGFQFGGDERLFSDVLVERDETQRATVRIALDAAVQLQMRNGAVLTTHAVVVCELQAIRRKDFLHRLDEARAILGMKQLVEESAAIKQLA